MSLWEEREGGRTNAESARRVILKSQADQLLCFKTISRDGLAVRRTDIFASFADVTLVKFNRNGVPTTVSALLYYE